MEMFVHTVTIYTIISCISKIIWLRNMNPPKYKWAKEFRTSLQMSVQKKYLISWQSII